MIMQYPPEKNNEDVLITFFTELNNIKQNNRSLVIITHGYIELFLNRIIDEKCKNRKKRITSNNRDFSLSVKLILLHELNYIDDTMYNLLDGFRKIRNRAAHDASFSIRKADWELLNSGLDRLIVGESKRKPNDLHHFCKLLICAIWNENLDIISNVRLT
jgi:hypothetical protein